jgi:DNA-binding IscR family transcriptional regulator
MHISQKGLYALQAVTVLAEHPAGVLKIWDVARILDHTSLSDLCCRSRN